MTSFGTVAHIALVVREMTPAVEFYETVLGFDPQRTGLDHVALTVADRAALEEWSARLDEHGVEHSPMRDAGYAEFVPFCDPDGIAWERWWAKG